MKAKRIRACLIWSAVVLGSVVGVLPANGQVQLPDWWDGESWVFEDLCPFEMDPRPKDPDAVDRFRYTMLDLDPGDDFYFTWVALPNGFGWDGMNFGVEVGEISVGTIMPEQNSWPALPANRLVFDPPVKSFEIVGLPGVNIDPLDPSDQRIFPVWFGWTPDECGADIAITPLPEPVSLLVFALGSVLILRR